MMNKWLVKPALAMVGLSALLVADAQQTTLPNVLADDVKWITNPGTPGLQNATLFGDPSKPGMYVVRVKFSPGTMTRPHTHTEDRYITVIKGTWWVGTGPEFEPSKTTPLKAGSFMQHPKGVQHYDGAKDEEAIVQIIGMGTVGTTLVKPAAGLLGSSKP
jgi:quercetin dioxygenase-like cupin family protein